MIKLTIEGKEFKICSSWDEVLFGQYIDILDIQKDRFNDIDRAVHIISAMSDNKNECSKALFKLTPDDFVSLQKHFDWYHKNVENFLSDETSEYFEIEGKKYVIKKDYDKLTLGEMISAEILMQNNKNLHPFEIGFGVLFRELDENGKPKEFDEEIFLKVVTDLRNKVKFVDVFKHINFFLSGEKGSTTKNTQGFSVEQI